MPRCACLLICTRSSLVLLQYYLRRSRCRYAQCTRLASYFVMDLSLQGGFACDIIHLKCVARKVCDGHAQGTDKVKKLHTVVATEAQKYVASMFEVHSEVQQLRDNLREQHRVWTEFYSTVNGVHYSVYCRRFTSGHCMTPYCKAQSSCQSHYHVSDLQGCAPELHYCSSHSRINLYTAGCWPLLPTFLCMLHKQDMVPSKQFGLMQ